MEVHLSSLDDIYNTRWEGKDSRTGEKVNNQRSQ